MAKEDLKILIVDDDEALCESLSDRFKAFNFLTLVAHSGDEGLKIANEKSVDIVVSDVQMKDGTGVNLLKELRKQSAETPKIFMISGMDCRTKDQMFDIGVDGFFEKPFDSRSLMNAIRKARMENKLRWQLTLNYVPTKMYFKKAESIEKFINSHQANLGRGGFCLAVDDPPSEGDRIDFHFKFSNSEKLSELRGIGFVHWVRVADKEAGKSVIGVEIEHVNPDDIEAFTEWLEEQGYTSFIPMSVAA